MCTIQYSNQSLPRETLWVLRGGLGLASQADPVESFVAGDVAKHGLTAMDGGNADNAWAVPGTYNLIAQLRSGPSNTETLAQGANPVRR